MGERDTEMRIKDVARKLFQEKGFAGTKTRDIAAAADINLASLNYYYRSKKKLFDIIMIESMQTFFSGILPIIEDEETTVKEKIVLLVDQYITMLSANPDMPTFIINEVRANPQDFSDRIGVLEKVKSSVLIRQFREAQQLGEMPMINPIHLMMNLLGLVVFPFIAAPMISTVTGISQDDLMKIIEERKELIPKWYGSMLQVK